MTMLNQAAVEALCSATYLENYLETMENLPDDLQRCVTQLRELDLLCMEMLQDIHNYKDVYRTESEGPSKRKAFVAIQRALIRSQEIGDEKLHLVSVIIEHIENRSRQLEQDLENLDPSTGKDHDKDDIIIISKPIKQDIEKVEKTAAKRQRRHRIHQDSISKEEDKKEEKVPKKKKKRKTKKDKDGDRSPIDPPIDPNEPTYCLCEQVSYGEMIGCDNDGCPIEWFHFNCVNLTIKPKGKWFCPKCRGDKSNCKRSDVKL